MKIVTEEVRSLAATLLGELDAGDDDGVVVAEDFPERLRGLLVDLLGPGDVITMTWQAAHDRYYLLRHRDTKVTFGVFRWSSNSYEFMPTFGWVHPIPGHIFENYYEGQEIPYFEDTP